MTNEKKPNADAKKPSPLNAAGTGTKPGQERKPEAGRKPDEKGKPSGQMKR